MALKITGVNPELTHTSPEHPLGIIVDDPKGGNKTYIYVRADDALVALNVAKRDFAVAGSAVAANVPFAATHTSAVTSHILGGVEVAIAAGDFGFLVYSGLFANANCTTGVLEDEVLGASSTAGRLIELNVASATVAEVSAIRDALAERKAVAMEDESSNAADVWLS